MFFSHSRLLDLKVQVLFQMLQMTLDIWLQDWEISDLKFRKVIRQIILNRKKMGFSVTIGEGKNNNKAFIVLPPQTLLNISLFNI